MTTINHLEKAAMAARGVEMPSYRDLQRERANHCIRTAIKNGMPINRKEVVKPSYIMTTFAITMALVSVYSIAAIIEKI